MTITDITATPRTNTVTETDIISRIGTFVLNDWSRTLHEIRDAVLAEEGPKWLLLDELRSDANPVEAVIDLFARHLKELSFIVVSGERWTMTGHDEIDEVFNRFRPIATAASFDEVTVLAAREQITRSIYNNLRMRKLRAFSFADAAVIKMIQTIPSDHDDAWVEMFVRLFGLADAENQDTERFLAMTSCEHPVVVEVVKAIMHPEPKR